MYQFPADMLQLFLAKKRDAWLRSDDPDVICIGSGSIAENAEQVNGLLHNVIDPTDRINDLFEGAPTKKTIHVLVVAPPEEKALSLHAEIASTLMEYTFMSVSSTAASKTQKMKEKLVKVYKSDCERSNQNGESMVLCMVMDIALPSSVVTASHIFRRKHDRLKDLCVKIDNIDKVKNGLLIFKPIKSALDDHDIVILVDNKDQFTLKILNPAIKTELLVDSLTQQQWEALGSGSLPTDWRSSERPLYAPNAPEFDVLTTFGELDGKALQFPRGSPLRPLRRCLYFQAQVAIPKAINEGWVPSDYKVDNFSSEGFTLEEKIELLFGNFGSNLNTSESSSS